MPEKAPKSFVYLPIPIETFRSFFCLDLIKSKNDAPLLGNDTTAFDLSAMMCDLFDLQEMRADLLAAQQSYLESLQLADNLTSTVVAAHDGGIFVAATYLKDGIKHHVMASGQLSIMPDGDDDNCYGLHTECFLAGHEKKTTGGTLFETDMTFIKILDGDDCYFDYATDVAEFYAGLNFMRFAMMSCVGGYAMDSQLNQMLLIADSINKSQEKFVDAIGYTELKKAMSDYDIDRKSFQAFLSQNKRDAVSSGVIQNRHLN